MRSEMVKTFKRGDEIRVAEIVCFRDNRNFGASYVQM